MYSRIYGVQIMQAVCVDVKLISTTVSHMAHDDIEDANTAVCVQTTAMFIF